MRILTILLIALLTLQMVPISYEVGHSCSEDSSATHHEESHCICLCHQSAPAIVTTGIRLYKPSDFDRTGETDPTTLPEPTLASLERPPRQFS
jgi:hypothetical protein